MKPWLFNTVLGVLDHYCSDFWLSRARTEKKLAEEVLAFETADEGSGEEKNGL